MNTTTTNQAKDISTFMAKVFTIDSHEAREYSIDQILSMRQILVMWQEEVQQAVDAIEDILEEKTKQDRDPPDN